MSGSNGDASNRDGSNRDGSRRAFLKAAGVLAAAATAGASCEPASRGTNGAASDGQPVSGTPRARGFDRAHLDALADAVLPDSLGEPARRAATDAFVAWIDGYDPVAEEMHGYGYADVRYLPPDPAPAWRAQLDGLDLLAQRSRHRRFAALTVAERRELLGAVLRRERGGDRLPSPLGASHIAIALLAHWASSPDAWDRALGVRVAPLTCRPLGDAVRAPLPLAGDSTRAKA